MGDMIGRVLQVVLGFVVRVLDDEMEGEAYIEREWSTT